MISNTISAAPPLRRSISVDQILADPAAGRHTVPSDAALVVGAQSGARGAFDSLVGKYRNRIFTLCLRYMHNPADAEDVVQETFMKAYRALRGFRGNCAFYSWLHSIAINSAKTAARQRHQDTTTFCSSDHLNDDDYDGHSLGQDLDTPERLALTEEIAHAVSESIDALSDEQRIALILREFDGFSYRQVAEEMKCPVGTVRSRVFRARDLIDHRVRQVFVDGLGR